MQFVDLLDRIKLFPSQRITVVGADGAEVSRTFAQFAADVDTLVMKLRDCGVQSGMRGGLLGPNSYDWMVWDVALATLGCISVAFPVENFQNRAEDLIDQYQLGFLAASDNLGCNTSEVTKGLMPLELDSTQEWFPVVVQPAETLPDDVHSLVFSSGTTGRLKGLIISAMGTENLVTLFENAFEFQQDDSHLIFLPFSGYQQRMVYYGCLYNGSGIIVVPYLKLFHELSKRQPSFVIAPPMFFETVQKLTKRKTEEATKQALASVLGGNVRAMITGMAAIKREALDFFWQHDIQLFEAYGITEAGMVAWNKPALHRVGTLGQIAEPNTVTLGEGNEVIICRKKPLSLGYFESSPADAAATFPSKNTVATGDIGHFDDEGFLTLVGRKKDIIVTKNGEKFHPEPIEIMLNNSPLIETSVIIGGEGIVGIVAMLNVTKNDDAARQAIKNHIEDVNQQLPDYQKIKKHVVVEKDFNLENGFRTQNLKINRKSIKQYYENL